MKQHTLCLFLCSCFLLLRTVTIQAQGFTLEDVRSYPFPSGLTAAAQGARIAWVFDEQGKRNVYVAEGPAFSPRKLTAYNQDDGQEITSLSVSADGKWVVYVRGGEHGAIWDETETVNPSSDPLPPKSADLARAFFGRRTRGHRGGGCANYIPKERPCRLY